MLRVAICDDEEYICSALERYTVTFCESMGIECEIEIFTTGESFIQHLDEDSNYHLIFLDIELTKCSGIDVSVHIREVLGNEAIQIAYVSGKNGYDRQLFAFRPFYFVDKPFDQNKIAAVLQKYLRIYGNKNTIFHYKVGHDSHWISLNEVMYFQSFDRKVIIKGDKRKDEFYGSLEKVKEQLKGQGFLCPHKSYYVNYCFIKSFHTNVMILTNDEEIPISKSKRKEIAQAQIMLENGGEIYVK